MDAVFSMEGTAADLATIAELAHRHGCRSSSWTEVHALGVLGPARAKELQPALECGAHGRGDGTFGKSFAVGGFIMRSFHHGPRPTTAVSVMCFSASLPGWRRGCHPTLTLRVSRREPDRRARVLAR